MSGLAVARDRPALPNDPQALLTDEQLRSPALAAALPEDELFQPAPAYHWGVYPEEPVLRDQYDGILFIDTVKPATWLQ